MCGRCRNVFNAFETLERIENAADDEVVDTAFLETRYAASHAAETLDDVKDVLQPVELKKANKALATDLYEADALVSHTEAQRKTTLLSQIAPQVAKQTEATSIAVAKRNAIPASGTGSALLDEPTPANQTPAQPTMPKPPATPIAAATENPLIVGALPLSTSPSSAWTWLATVAGIALLLQSIYFYRSQIVQHYPQLRPALAAGCEVIGCTLSWGRDQAMIKIESSDLIEPPGRQGKILLMATLANRAATKQDYPALEVKLTDASNAIIASRVLTPLEYLGRSTLPEEGLPPNAELYINLNLELVGKSVASGYGLKAFYN